MTSAFIIEVNSQLQPDPNEDTATLLRVLIYKMDNTTFGDDVPTIPQWNGPPRTIVVVQAILFASLAVSLFSAFLAMLGKQWLNRYASVGMRGSVIERGQDRQGKLDGIISWYFNHVMESLPMMLQAALLLLGCALSRYFWEISKTVASVVIGATVFGILFFLFIIVAGAASANCPYQTPGAHVLRYILDTLCHIPNTFHHIPDAIRHICYIPGLLHSVFTTSIERSMGWSFLILAWEELQGIRYSLVNIVTSLTSILLLPIGLIVDSCRAVIWVFIALPRGVYILLQRGSKERTAVLDLHCILWTLRTSVDEPVRLSTLSYLATAPLAHLDPTLVVDCFDILFGCVKAIEGTVTIAQGLEQLATVSALCCLHTLSHLAIMNPTPRVFGNIHRRYTQAFPFETNFNLLPFSHILGAIHSVFYLTRMIRVQRPKTPMWSGLPMIHFRRRVQWEDYKPSNDEHVVVSHALTKLAKLEYQRRGSRDVPRWLLRFALHSLSQSPLPPTSVVANCLTIIAIDLGHDFPRTETFDERCVGN